MGRWNGRKVVLYVGRMRVVYQLAPQYGAVSSLHSNWWALEYINPQKAGKAGFARDFSYPYTRDAGPVIKLKFNCWCSRAHRSLCWNEQGVAVTFTTLCMCIKHTSFNRVLKTQKPKTKNCCCTLSAFPSFVLEKYIKKHQHTSPYPSIFP